MEALEQTLRSVLTPLTHNLPTPISDAATNLLGASCYRSLVHDLTITDSECLKLGISKGLGIAIISASAIVKIPQLLKLLNSRSASGVSFLAYLLETASYLISLAYNARKGFPFSTYGETALIAVQNVAISVLVLQYNGMSAGAAVFVAGLAAAGYASFSEEVVSMGLLQYLQAGAGVLGVASKVPQIVAIAREGGTGQLSAFAVGVARRALGGCWIDANDAADRSSTTFLAPSRASSRRCRRWTISSFWEASLRASRSMPCSRCKWSTTGTARAVKPHRRRRSRRRANKRWALRRAVVWTLGRARARRVRDVGAEYSHASILSLSWIPKIANAHPVDSVLPFVLTFHAPLLSTMVQRDGVCNYQAVIQWEIRGQLLHVPDAGTYREDAGTIQ